MSVSGRRAVGKKMYNWASLVGRASEPDKPHVSKIREKYETQRASMIGLSEKPIAIDWEYYKKQAKSHTQMVQDFQKQLEPVLEAVPYPKDDKTVTRIEEFEKEREALAQAKLAEAKALLVTLQADLDKLLAEKPLEDMTIDDYLVNRPELRKKADEDMYNHKWHDGWWM